MNKGRVYLAGPITGLDYQTAAKGWRQQAFESLADRDIQAMSPMRFKGYLEGETFLKDKGYEENPCASAKGIVSRDRFDCQRADVVLANFLDAPRASLGTAIEFGWADAARIPIVMIVEEDSIHDHAMLTEMAGFIVNNLEDAIDIVDSLLSLEV